jgi:hypothetical protein
MQGVFSAVESLTATVASLAATGLFYVFTSHFPPENFPERPSLLPP